MPPGNVFDVREKFWSNSLVPTEPGGCWVKKYDPSTSMCASKCPDSDMCKSDRDILRSMVEEILDNAEPLLTDFQMSNKQPRAVPETQVVLLKKKRIELPEDFGFFHEQMLALPGIHPASKKERLVYHYLTNSLLAILNPNTSCDCLTIIFYNCTIEEIKEIDSEMAEKLIFAATKKNRKYKGRPQMLIFPERDSQEECLTLIRYIYESLVEKVRVFEKTSEMIQDGK